MSGVEIVVAAAAVSLIASGASAYQQIQTANKSAEMQATQIREQQVQTRLQQNQNSIERMKKLQQVLATEEVTFGARNISGASGTVRALVSTNMAEFYSDEHADRLNFGAKQVALARQKEMVWMNRRAQVFNAVTGFVKEGANTVMSAAGVPSESLINKSAAGGGAGGVSSSAGAQSFQTNQRSQFDLNAR